MAEHGETCSSAHLARDPFGPGDDAPSGVVAVRKCERRIHSVAVSFQAPGEGVEMK